MVDLVKLRRKAKEKQQQAAALADQRPPDAAAAALDVPPPPAQPIAAAPPKSEAQAHEEQPARKRPKAGSPKSAPASENAATAPEPEVAGDAAAPARPHVAPGSAERLEKFMESAGTLAEQRQAVAAQTSDAIQIELLTFMIGAEQYAVAIDTIVEIIPPRPPTRVPNADPSIVGVISLRGTVVTLLDVHRKLGHARLTGADPRVVVVERGGETVGFVVDRVLRVIKIDPLDIASHPVATPSEQSEYIWGVLQQDRNIFILLDLEKLIQA